MPPRSKHTRSAKVIKGTVTPEDISEADNHVSNQSEPQESAATSKRRGAKVAIPTKERGEADGADLPNTIVSIRSSKQKALHKIMSMDKEDADDCKASVSALKTDDGESSHDHSATGATADPEKTNKKKQRSRAKHSKKILETLPEDIAMEAHFVKLGSMTVSTCKATQLSEFCTNKKKSDRGKRRGAHATEKDQCKLQPRQEEEQQGTGLQQGEKQQGNGPQEGGMITCPKALKESGDSSMQPPGHSADPPPNQALDNLSKKMVDCLSVRTEKLACFTQALAKPEPSKDQILNVRHSTRTKKVVYYSEQSPESDSIEKRVFKNSESMAPAASKMNDSAAKLLPRGVKRVKEDLTNAPEGPSGLGSRRATSFKRGKRHQELTLPQNLTSKSSTASTETWNKEKFKEIQEEGNLQQVSGASANNADLDKDILLQTAQLESVKVSPFTKKKDSDRIAGNQVIQNITDEPSSCQVLSKTAGKVVAQTMRGRKTNRKRRALPDASEAVQKDEDDRPAALPLQSADQVKHKVLEAATRKNTSSSKSRPCGIKMVKENQGNAQEETVEPESGRAHQNLGSLQNFPDKKSTAFKSCSENAEVANTLLVSLNSVDLDKAFLLQTGQTETIKFSPPAEGTKLFSALRLEKTSNAGSMTHGKRESDHIVHNQDPTVADKGTRLEVMSVIAASKNDRKKLTAAKGRKAKSRQKALPGIAQIDKGDLLDDLSLGSGEEAKPEVLEALLVEGAAISMIDANPKDICGTYQSADADKNFNCESQSRRSTLTEKKSLKRTTQQAKKQKILVLDTLSLPSSLDMLVEGALPVQNQEYEKAFQEVEHEDWNAVDLTESKCRAERSSEKQRKEERKRKRAMKFDALPVGFGLGISCWSTPTWAGQCLEEEVAGEEDLPVMGSQDESKIPIEEVKKQQCPQKTATPIDAENVNSSLRHKEISQEMESSVLGLQVQLNNGHVEEAKKRQHLQEIPMSNNPLGIKDSNLAHPHSATGFEGSSFSNSDAERLPASGLKSVTANDLNHQPEKGKVKRQAARKTTKAASKTVLVELPANVYTGSDNSIVDKENVEPKLDAHHDSELKTSRKSQRRRATTGVEKSTRTRRN